MNQARIAQLELFRKEDPNDPFPIYALAMEYLSEFPEKSRELFEYLIENHPDYIGTYYHAADLYSHFGDREKAEITYQNGIKKATMLKDSHALRELQSAYTNFQFDE